MLNVYGLSVVDQGRYKNIYKRRPQAGNFRGSQYGGSRFWAEGGV